MLEVLDVPEGLLVSLPNVGEDGVTSGHIFGSVEVSEFRTRSVEKPHRLSKPDDRVIHWINDA